MGFLKKQRLNWLGHVERMAEDNSVKKIKRWKPMSKRPIGRPKTCWEEEVFGRHKEHECMQLEECGTEHRWKKVVEQARILNRLWHFTRRK